MMKIIALFEAKLSKVLKLVGKLPKRRWLATELDQFVSDAPKPTVCLLFGVLRSGKTTLMLQCIANLPEAERKKCVFFQIRKPKKKDERFISGDSLWDLQKDMQDFIDQGYSYFL
ncbi:MAG: hypothetical protein IJS50_03035 [Desulfovibrio sp.]|nr:hypothetical protein [Desulfovibrio sp.]